ncbi:MAG TPA: DUF411 domain-containing protein [Alphaproteobacteria bacterium]|nr:DUF411 domain-containing protein [Alphaproteobacteria bacterium]
MKQKSKLVFRRAVEVAPSPVSRRALLALVLAGLAGPVSTRAWAADERRKLTLYKDPECGCCEGYADYLRKHGFEVNVVPTHDLTLLDEKYGISDELAPCHLSLVDGYVVGGHVPVEVVNRLLTERPKITGITLPGMPQGSPGMTGRKIAPFNIFEITRSPYRLYAVV